MNIPILLSKSRIYLGLIVLLASVFILSPRWRASLDQRLRLPETESLQIEAEKSLEPTISNAMEINARVDLLDSSLQPIAIQKKNSWNPSPSWRSDAAWPTHGKPIELRPVTIEKIPDSLAPNPFSKHSAPTIGDALTSRSVANSASVFQNPGEVNHSRVVPWSALADEPSVRLQKLPATLAPPQPHPIAIGQTVSSETSLPTSLTVNQAQVDRGLSVNDKRPETGGVQQFIRQPTTRR